MKLIEIVRDLGSFDSEEDIYASEPWTAGCEAIVTPESNMSSAVERLNMKYFLEVFIARDFLNAWSASLEDAPTLQEKCARLIQYAIHDA